MPYFTMDFQSFCRQYQLDNLNPQQECAIKTTEGPVLLLAVPGSGKTTVIVARTGYLLKGKGIHPSNILTLTYTKAAATEMRDRFIRKFGETDTPHFSTINSFCVSVLRKCEREKGEAIPDLEPNPEKVIRRIAAQMKGEYPSDGTVRDLSSLITKVKNLMYSDEQIALIDETDGLDFADFYNAYQDWLHTNNLMDFDDQMVLAYAFLQKYPDILQRIRRQYLYIQCDEAQDTSLIQHKLLQAMAGRNGNIMMVGDEDQSIYGFRGAVPKQLLTFRIDYDNATVLYMETNYRSKKDIVKITNQFIKQNKDRNEKNMVSFRDEAGGHVEITTIKDNADTPVFLYQTVLNFLKEPTASLAILFRNNESIAPLINLLQTNNIKVRARDNLNLFLTNYLVKDIRAFLEFSLHPDDIEIFKQIYYKMGLYLKATELPEIINALQSQPTVMDALLSMNTGNFSVYRDIITKKRALIRISKSSPIEAIKIIINDIGYGGKWLQSKVSDGSSTADNILNRIDVLRTIARNYKTIPEFLEGLNKLAAYESYPLSNVTLSTIHSAKGLEFDTVIVIDCISGILPSDSTNKTKEEEEEDVRLFYVAATRAKEELYIVSPQSWFNRKMHPSIFTMAVEAEKKKVKKA